MKSYKLLIIFIFISIKMHANETIIVNQNQFFIDTTNHIVLTNMDIDYINTNWIGLKTNIMIGELCSFISPVSTIEIGTPYSIFIPSQNSNFILYFTEFPIISISTSNTIVDEPDVWANFKMIEKNQNYLESDIGIQYRGGYSQSLPKKSMEIKFWTDALGTDTEDHSLLNMVTEDSWNLQAMANEPLRIRNKTNFDIWRIINDLHYIENEPEAINAVRMNYVELFVNNEYRGIYCLGEKVKRKQLKLKKHNGTIRGELYKGDHWGNTTFYTLPPFDNNSDIWDGFEYKHPDEEINWQNLYDLSDFIINSTDTDFYANYSTKFHIDNLVDYYIFLNLLRATDNTGKNIYIAKYDTNTPYFYVPWDLDGTFGTMWTGSNDTETQDLLTNGFYDRLINDCSENGFRDKLRSKWQSLRQNDITHSSIMNMFNTNYNLLLQNGVYERETLVWDDFDYYTGNLTYMSDWITDRLSYLDTVFNEECDILSRNEFDSQKNNFKIYPNPASDFVEINSTIESIFSLEIYNNLGQIVLTENFNTQQKQIDLSNLSKGIYIFKIKNKDLQEVHKIIVNR